MKYQKNENKVYENERGMMNMMNTTQPLTLEQQQFAEDNHNLVYLFLKVRHLSEDMYDTVIFGYLKAVANYFERPELRKYSFSTIAGWCMASDLHNHYRKQNRHKYQAYVIDYDMVCVDTVEVEDDIVSSLLLEEIISELPAHQANVIVMKSEGYTNREIAMKYNVSANSIQKMLSSIREAIYPRLV